MNKLYLLISLAAIMHATPSSLLAQDRQEYISQYSQIAISEMERTGIPASIKIAQGILESNAGASMLAIKANNHFGIKCGGDWRGRAMYKQDDDRNAHGKPIKSCFRWFDSPEESFIAHSEFIRDPAKTDRYGFLFDLDPMDYKAWAYGLKRAGYATNPNYPKLLIGIIENYGLQDLDRAAMQELADAKSDIPLGPIAKDLVGSLRAYPVEYYNKVKTVTAYKGDSPASLSERLDVPVKKILKNNATVSSPSEPFEPGERVYLKSKKKAFHGDQKYHIIKPGETMAEISDQYGIKLNKLYKRNGMEEGTEAAAGQKIVLRGKNKGEVKLRKPQKPQSRSIRQVPGTDSTDDEQANGDAAKPIESNTMVPDPGIEVISSYTVQKSDTLYQIARMHGLSVAQLKKINNLTGDLIHPGQILKLQE